MARTSSLVTLVAALFLTPLFTLSASPVFAQSPATAALSPDMTIPLPPGVEPEFEFDGKDEDLLGMVKSLLEGAKSDGKGKPGVSMPQTSAGMFLGFLSSDQMTNLFKDVRHLRLLYYKLPQSPVDGTATAGNATTTTSVLPFYETPLRAAGGRRLLYSKEGTRILIMGFDAPRGMAVIVQDKQQVTVARTLGYLDMKVVGELFRTFATAQVAEDEEATKPAPAAPASKPKAKPNTKPDTKPVSKRRP